MTVYGWDASDYDWSRGPMDLGAARRDGIDFFTHKATEGGTVVHTHYGDALGRARAAGIPYLGAYIVCRTPGNSVAYQVDHFMNYVNAQTPWWATHPGWFFQVDLEHWGYDNVSPAVGVETCRLIRERTGRAVLLYAPQWSYGDSIPGTDPLWASNYGTNPAAGYLAAYPGDTSTRWAGYSGRTPAILQYGSLATIGNQPGSDANAFRGTLAQFSALIAGGNMLLTDDDIARIWAYLVGANDIAGDRRQPAGNLLKDCADMLNRGASSYDGRVGWMPGQLTALAAAAAADAGRDAVLQATVAAMQVTVSALADTIKAGGGSVDVTTIGALIDAAVEKVRVDVAAHFTKLTAAAKAQADTLAS